MPLASFPPVTNRHHANAATVSAHRQPLAQLNLDPGEARETFTKPWLRRVRPTAELLVLPPCAASHPRAWRVATTADVARAARTPTPIGAKCRRQRQVAQCCRPVLRPSRLSHLHRPEAWLGAPWPMEAAAAGA